jgi:hypothetical protein
VSRAQAADYRGCVFVRDHVVLPDRATVVTGPYNSAPILAKLGFSRRQIDGYLKSQYGGVDPALLEAAPPERSRSFPRARARADEPANRDA